MDEREFEVAVRAMSEAWDLRVQHRNKWLSSCRGDITWTHWLSDGTRSASYGRSTWKEAFCAIAWHGIYEGLVFPDASRHVMWSILHELEEGEKK